MSVGKRKYPKRIIHMSVVPGQPTDGTGRICIHLFIKDVKGSFIEPHCLHPALDKNKKPIKGQLIIKPARGRIVCNRKLIPKKHKKTDKIFYITHRTDDPRAVTCPKCMETEEFKTLLAQQGE